MDLELETENINQLLTSISQKAKNEELIQLTVQGKGEIDYETEEEELKQFIQNKMKKVSTG